MFNIISLLSLFSTIQPHTTTHFTGDSIKAGDDLLKWFVSSIIAYHLPTF